MFAWTCIERAKVRAHWCTSNRVRDKRSQVVFKPFIPCPEARKILANGGQLVDVRSPQEFAQSGLPGAVNLPLQSLQQTQRELDPKRPVIVYCLSGARSAQAQMMLENMGFAEVHNLGGYQNYYHCD